MVAPTRFDLALIGDSRALRSLSPRMHNHVLRKHGLDGHYRVLAVETDQVPEAVASLARQGLRGANVTVPHKRAVMPCLAELSPLARAVGAVNTIVNDGGRLWGDNTDVGGFVASLAQAGFDPADRVALVLGAGGASRALLLALVRHGCRRVWLAARRDDQARDLAGRLGVTALPWADLETAAPQVDLLVNATAASSALEAPDFSRRALGLPLAAGGLVCDINYGREQNFWRDLATLRGCGFCDGLPMLVHQARLSFKIWTGVDAPAADFFEALEQKND